MTLLAAITLFRFVLKNDDFLTATVFNDFTRNGRAFDEGRPCRKRLSIGYGEYFVERHLNRSPAIVSINLVPDGYAILLPAGLIMA